MPRNGDYTLTREDIDEALALQAMRKEAGINRPQLADLLGISPVQYMDYERAHCRIPLQTLEPNPNPPQ
jgi:DNA-binding XRE family transcriptional regulator